MTQREGSDSAWALEVAELREHGTVVYVVSTQDRGETGGVVHAVFSSARRAVEYAHTCHLCLTEGETILIEGFIWETAFDPTTVRVERPDLVEREVIEG
jgi:hypothetical protein